MDKKLKKIVAGVTAMAITMSIASATVVNQATDNIVVMAEGKLIIDDLTEIKIGCQVQKGYDISDFKFSCEGANVNVYDGEDGYYYISIKGITPDKFDNIYAVNVKGTDSEITVYCSAFAYLKTILGGKNYGTDMKNLAKSMYEYNVASKAYNSSLK